LVSKVFRKVGGNYIKVDEKALPLEIEDLLKASRDRTAAGNSHKWAGKRIDPAAASAAF
jgi:hypothetical protein